ncbi:hypothetical protein EYR40_005898 [Pleurotus pulmonarius]|nr:hypothetical protein EYR40_005898 [Pleurotus pulmonarius]
MNVPEVEAESLLPVKNLRSKFEQLAVQAGGNDKRHSIANGELLDPGRAGSPRPRAASGGEAKGRPDVHHLRSSSSSSDLRPEGSPTTSTKRPPPPPPPRGSKGLSPSPSPRPSPLMRPVPIPAALLNLPALEGNQSVLPSLPPRVSSPRPGVPPPPPPPLSRPSVPPRPLKLQNHDNEAPKIHSPEYTHSPEEVVSPPSFTINPPPALPPRKATLLPTSSNSSLSSFDSSPHSSRTSSESDPFPARSPFASPPRPPPRPRVTLEPSPLPSAPPLPMRRGTLAVKEEGTPPDSPATSTPRKVLGTGKLPPPPTRTIAVGDKLPPAKRPPAGGSSDDESDEEETETKGLDLLPDSSHSSRRPPTLSYVPSRTETKVHMSSYTNLFAVSGAQLVIATHHHIKIYDLATGNDHPILSIDNKDLGAKEIKVTSMEFRASSSTADRGYLLWIGTKEGHIFEMDVRTGGVVRKKYAAHLHPVTYIFRYGNTMVSLDESGKALVYTPEAGYDVDLATTPQRVVRVTDKQDFARLIGGKLWTACRSDAHAPGTTARTPIIRIYDLFTQGATGRSMMPSEHVGPVTSATILPSHPGHVYVGHEEGYVSIWVMEAEDNYPKCIEVIKISTSDVLCLEGVHDRLWAGGRNGTITAYDVSSRPFVVTNSWVAHVTMPVIRLSVDHIGIEKTRRLCVVSAGKDDMIKLWDGLLGLDWVDNELTKHENEFSTYHDARILMVSWNVDAARPDMLTGDPENISFLRDALTSVDSPDIIVFGFQEVIDLESRKMTAKNVLLGGKKKPEDGGLSDRVTGAYKRWHDALVLAVRTAMPPDVPYVVVLTESLVGLFSCVFVKHSQRALLKDMSITSLKRGIGGRYGNKGGIISRFVVEDTSFCFLNCHLAAGQHALRQRNADIGAVLESKTLFPPADHPLAYVGGGDGAMVLDHELVFIGGDLNYRIDQRRDPIVAAVRAGEHESLWVHDQLLKEVKYNKACRLRGFSEGPLRFPPTYKYDRRSNEYDNSEKRRPPAWCDRILWRSNVQSRVKQIHYKRYEANVSDHRPISAGFLVTLKRAQADLREGVRMNVTKRWSEEHYRLVEAARAFYANQLVI